MKIIIRNPQNRMVIIETPIVGIKKPRFRFRALRG